MLGKFSLPFLSTPILNHTTVGLGASPVFNNNVAPSNEILNDLAWLSSGN